MVVVLQETSQATHTATSPAVNVQVYIPILPVLQVGSSSECGLALPCLAAAGERLSTSVNVTIHYQLQPDTNC